MIVLYIILGFYAAFLVAPLIKALIDTIKNYIFRNRINKLQKEFSKSKPDLNKCKSLIKNLKSHGSYDLLKLALQDYGDPQKNFKSTKLLLEQGIIPNYGHLSQAASINSIETVALLAKYSRIRIFNLTSIKRCITNIMDQNSIPQADDKWLALIELKQKLTAVRDSDDLIIQIDKALPILAEKYINGCRTELQNQNIRNINKEVLLMMLKDYPQGRIQEVIDRYDIIAAEELTNVMSKGQIPIFKTKKGKTFETEKFTVTTDPDGVKRVKTEKVEATQVIVDPQQTTGITHKKRESVHHKSFTQVVGNKDTLAAILSFGTQKEVASLKATSSKRDPLQQESPKSPKDHAVKKPENRGPRTPNT